jgi:hypothetical protein
MGKPSIAIIGLVLTVLSIISFMYQATVHASTPLAFPIFSELRLYADNCPYRENNIERRNRRELTMYQYKPLRFYITVFAVTWGFWIPVAFVGEKYRLLFMLFGFFVPAVTAKGFKG